MQIQMALRPWPVSISMMAAVGRGFCRSAAKQNRLQPRCAALITAEIEASLRDREIDRVSRRRAHEVDRSQVRD
jgi:hypothetical protein